MAKLNGEIIDNNEVTQKECSMYLQSCLSNEELKELKAQWNQAGGWQKIAWWKYAFENIKVALK